MKAAYRPHIIGWLLFLGYDYFDYFSKGDVDFQGLMIVSSYNLILILTFYLSYFYLSDLVPGANALLKTILIISLGILGFILTRYFIQEILFEIFFGFSNYYRDDFAYYILDNIWRGAVPVTGGMLVRLVEKKNEDEKYQLRLKQEKTAAELSFLRSQINPHFLFNTMSFLYSEAFTIDEKLANTILKLSELLRYALESAKADEINIGKEVTILNNYIDIFKNRFEGKCFVDFDYTNTDQSLEIEPLLLLPFVENAFKHGVSSDSEHPLRIKLKTVGKQLYFDCQNRINRFQKDESSGIGIGNVRKRLDLLYPGFYNLEITKKEDEGIFQVSLEITL